MKKIKKMKPSSFNIYLILIIISSFFMSYGFAAISSINFTVTGSATATPPKGLFIEDVVCNDSTANGTIALINMTNKTIMDSTITLSSSSSSTVTCEVTVFNNSNNAYNYIEAVYGEDDYFYDNDNISFNVSGINSSDVLTAKQSVTFNVTFRYRTGYTPSSTNTLNSLIYFKFDQARWYDGCTSSSSDLKCKLITAQTPYADNVSSSNVSNSSGINFSQISSSTNGRGLYYTADKTKTEDVDNDGDGERVYFYRGNVTNNFVIFDSYCWRIVRINEDATIKLIYAGTPSNGSCPQNGSSNVYTTSSAFNSTYTDNTAAGYMYGTTGASSYSATHANTNNSTIKTTIDNWYNTNLSDNASFIADEVFCNDRTLTSGNGYGTSTSVYAPEDRFYGSPSNQKPYLKCDQANDRFTVNSSMGNKKLTYPIGLLTADEINYAGMIYINNNNSTSSDSFLYSGNTFWTMSPGDLDSSGFWVYYVSANGYLRLIKTNTTSAYIRPVINLLSTVKFKSGTGTYNNPYQIDGVVSDDPEDPPVVATKWYEDCTSSDTKLNCKMITSTTPSSDSGISFSTVSSSSNTNGLYYTSSTSLTEDTDGDTEGDRVYYYRGNVTNNFVYFGGYCWRIVRTNEDSSIKLVYGGTMSNNSCPQNGTSVSISSSTFNSSSNDNTYVGYMYGTRGASNYNNTHSNTTSSAVKTAIDNWYNSNLSSYSSYLSDQVFCNDRGLYSGNGYGTSITSYNGYNRIYSNKSPTFICSQNNDKFTTSVSTGNGKLSYPIGLLTADEVSFAGGVQATNNTSYYLYTSAAYWTMTPSDYYSGGNSTAAYVFYVDTSGQLRINNNLSTSMAIRPVINIKETVVVSSGSGTYNSPYQLSLP